MSAILSADDLNDFISPGVACIKPVETLPFAPAAANGNGAELEHEVIRDGEPGAGGAPPPASISLTDCLACSGCVTSAEAVLVSLQSHKEMLRALDAAPALQLLPLPASSVSEPASASASPSPSTSSPPHHPLYVVDGLDDPARQLYVASVSPQSRANLATACGPGVTARQAGYMLEHLLSGPNGLRAGANSNGNGFAWVVDTNAAREATLVLGADEVAQQLIDTNTNTSSPQSPKAPLLTSSCPGWVCYAEKTHPYVLGHLSRVKSPQALTGTLLKTTLSRTLGIPPSRIWHVAIMPCFDKKLEASREELTDAAWDGSGSGSGSGKKHDVVRDVDCVITSKEVLMLAESRGIDFFSLPRTPPSRLSSASALALLPQENQHQHQHQPSLQRLPFPDAVLDRFFFPPHLRSPPVSAAGSSGGNLHFVLQSVLAQHPGSSLQTTRGRNVDVVEYAITAPGVNEPLFRAARYYGFRNIQNIVRRLRPARPSRLPGARRAPTSKAGAGLDFTYVEVMACPGGCTNGGGQIKADDGIVVARKGLTSKPGPQEQREWLVQVDEAYFSADDDVDESSASEGRPTDEIDGISPLNVRHVLAHWACITGIDLQRLAYTTYREVLSDVGKAGKGGDAVDRVAQLAGKIGGGW